MYSIDKNMHVREFKEAQGANEELKHIDPLIDYTDEHGVEMPAEGAVIDLPVSVEMPTGHRVQSMYLLSEENRKTQEMFDGSMMKHEYTRAYSDIIKIVMI